MKRIITFLGLVLLSAAALYGQKKALDHSVYDAWQSTSAPKVSDDGKVVIYRVAPQEGDGFLYVNNLENGKKICIERAESSNLSNDGHYVVFSIKAPFAETRQAKIKKKSGDEMPKDSLGILDTYTMELTTIPDIKNFKTNFEKDNVILYQSGKKDSVWTVVFKAGSEKRDSLLNVDRYSFDVDGSQLAVVFKKTDKDSLSRNEVRLYQLSDMSYEVLASDKHYYSVPSFSNDGNKVVFLASADSNKTGNKYCSIYLYEKGKSCEEIIPQGYSEGLPKGFAVTEDAAPYFSKLADRIILGIKEPIPENDTTLVDFETAQVDIWNWDVYLTPPMQKVQSSSLKTLCCEAVINLNEDRNKIVTLSSKLGEGFYFTDGAEGDYAIAVDDLPYAIHATWDDNTLCDVYKVDMKTGGRTLLFKSHVGYTRLSPAGKYLVWYSTEDLNYHSYRLSDGKEFNLTGKLKGIFYDDEDDHPMPNPEIDSPHWIEDDEAFLLADKYDIWKIYPDGKKAVCLTEGEGKKHNIQYRYTDLTRSTISSVLSKAGVRKTIGRDEVVYLTSYDRTEKKNGYASVSVAKSGLIDSFVDEHTYASAYKALNANTIVYRKGDFRHPYDVYCTEDGWKNSEKLSSINPQQDEYRWGDVKLVHWNAYDGTPLDGLLYTPDDMEKGKKYPMICYFYEKSSDTRYDYISPAPSRSIICIPFYVSRGYVVFVPDIVYEDGHPGESAYNCICAGAEAMCDQFDFIDKSKMAIQGQSWGGYQTAYLVTRTDMFAAAGAGAPVGNMTSAYGGVRWESGHIRAVQYEHGQSRIGKSLWDEGGLDLYIENSPVFHTQNVKTPVLIMHNDADGAVPWYQGIEFFLSLRRFDHPAWLLEYNDEAHNLVERRNCKDLTIRLQQFFDHYLKGDPMPAWMKYGVPITRKGQYFGFEYAE